MRDLILLFVHVLATSIRLARPGGVRSVLAESVLLKHQLLILNRSRRRAPNLRASDRLIARLCALLMLPRRLVRSAVVVKPSTLLNFYRALVHRKYRYCQVEATAGRLGQRTPIHQPIRDTDFLRRGFKSERSSATIPVGPRSHPESLSSRTALDPVSQPPDIESPLLPYLARNSARSNICLINQCVSPMTVPTSIREWQVDNTLSGPLEIEMLIHLRSGG